MGGIPVDRWVIPAAARSVGMIAEFGVYDGATTKLLAALGRPVYAFDTFEGMPNDGTFVKELDWCNPPGKFAPSKDLTGLWENVILVKGRFQDTLPTVDSELKFGFVFVDCDWYESHRVVLEWLSAGHLCDDAVVAFDDYNHCAGAKKAIDEWTSKHGLTLVDDWKVHYDTRNV